MVNKIFLISATDFCVQIYQSRKTASQNEKVIITLYVSSEFYVEFITNVVLVGTY